MYGKVKLTKRQIKEDKFTTFMLTAKHQFVENWQFFVIGIAAVILVVVGIIYYLNSQQTKKAQADENFSQALLEYRAGNTQVALMSLNQLLEDFPGTSVADQATFILAKMNYESRNYVEALRYYQMFVDNQKEDKFLRTSAIGGIAACYENQGNYLEAARKFTEAIGEYPDGPLAGDHHLGAMRNFLAAGDIEAARTHLNTIKDKFSGTDLEPRATRLFAEISGR